MVGREADVVTTWGSATPSAPAPLRLRLAGPPSPSELDGGWWPHSRDLSVELAALVAEVLPALGRITRAAIVTVDWDAAPSRVEGPGGQVKIVSLPRVERHVIELRTAGRRRLRLLVVPAALSAGQGEEALLAAATPGNTYTASSIMQVVAQSDDATLFGHWPDPPSEDEPDRGGWSTRPSAGPAR